MLNRSPDASGGGGSSSGGATGNLPTRGLTLNLSMIGDVTVDPTSGLIVALGNTASGPNYYFNHGGTAPAYNATGINGTPAAVIRNVDAPLFTPHSSNNAPSDFLQPAGWTIAGSLQYTGAVTLNTASLRTMPQIIGAQADPPESPGVCVALDPADGTKIRIVAYWTPDDVTYHFVEGPAVAAASPHYFLVTFQAVPGTDSGTLTIYIDALPAVTSAGNAYTSIVQWQGQVFQAFSNGISTGSRLDALFGELDAWNVCLTAAEIKAALAALKSNGAY